MQKSPWARAEEGRDQLPQAQEGRSLLEPPRTEAWLGLIGQNKGIFFTSVLEHAIT